MGERENSLPSPRLTIGSGGLARLVFDDPDKAANVLTAAVVGRLSELFVQLRLECTSGAVRGVLITSAKPASFIVGADVKEIAAIDDPNDGAEAARTGQTAYLELERLPVPTVAAIHGVCMGGGTELALACRYRLASDAAETRIGLPEVQLGILPAWGGTTRLPRLVGLKHALDLLLTGKTLDGRRSKRIGLIDEVFPHDLFEELAEGFLRRIMEDGVPPRSRHRGIGSRLLEDTAPGRRVLLTAARRRVLAQTGGHYPAPLRILDVLKSSLGRPLEKALENEALVAGELIASRVSKNLVHVFGLRETARKGVPKVGGAQPRPVRLIGVVGAGTMGGGVAQLAASHGIRVRLRDLRREAVSLALEHARELFDSGVRRYRFTQREADEAMELISGSLDYSGFGPADLVVEAVVERLDVKKAVLQELEATVGRSCVLATNTSSLSLEEMAEALESPERFVGMHFFNPVHKMPLIEVVRGKHTGDEAVAIVYALAVRMGKVPVVVRDGPGFLVNRILSPYLNEAGHLLSEGASVDSIDQAAKDFGMPMGPLRLIDEVGIDIVRHAGEILHEAFGDRLEPAPALLTIGESGRLGKKGGSGFYKYDKGREAGVDTAVYELLSREAEPGPVPSRGEIRDRLLLALINETARALEDGISTSAGEVDLALIMGTGFPPFLGGLLRFADEIHPRALVERLEGHEESCGERFSPAPLLRRLAREDRGFYEAYPGR